MAAADLPLVVIANPRAGGGEGGEAVRAVEAAFAARGRAVVVHLTEGPDHAARLALEAARRGAASVVAVGGDGTLHEVANGVLLARLPEPPPLGQVPVGSGNDYAKMLGVPAHEPAEAARIVLDGALRRVDAGRLEGGDRGAEFFVNNVGLAFTGQANAAHEELRALPARLAYLAGGIKAFLAFRADSLEVTVDGVSVRDRFLIAHVGIGRYCGAGIDLTPGATLADGVFHVSLVAGRPRLAALVAWPRIARGEPLPDSAVLRGRRVRVWGPRGLVLHADGEVRRCPAGVLEATLLPGALRVHATHP